MYVPTPKWNSATLWVTLLILGLLGEFLILKAGHFFGAAWGYDSIKFRGLLLLLTFAYVLSAALITDYLCHIDIVPAASMVTLSLMLSWLAVVLIVCFVAFLIALALYAEVAIPIRVLVHFYEQVKKALVKQKSNPQESKATLPAQ